MNLSPVRIPTPTAMDWAKRHGKTFVPTQRPAGLVPLSDALTELLATPEMRYAPRVPRSPRMTGIAKGGMTLADVVKAMPSPSVHRVHGGAVPCQEAHRPYKHAHHATPMTVPVGMSARITINGVPVA